MELPRPSPQILARLLPPDIDLTLPQRRPQARDVWIGTVWSRMGRGDLAWLWWDGVVAEGLTAWLAAERGRVLRELGLHPQAERLEAAGLHRAVDAVDAAMLQVSLVADAVGYGDTVSATDRLAAATVAVDALPDTPRAARQRLRLSWVGVEVAYLRGEHPSPHALADLDAGGAPVLPDDHRFGSDFHTAKGLLFAGIVRGSLPLLDHAAALAPPVLAWAIQLARADLGAIGARTAARRAWAEVVAPPAWAAAVAATATARRLTGGEMIEPGGRPGYAAPR